jgi:hypothetical protein
MSPTSAPLASALASRPPASGGASTGVISLLNALSPPLPLRATSTRLSLLRAFSTAVRASSSAAAALVCRPASARADEASNEATPHHSSAASTATAHPTRPGLSTRLVRRRSPNPRSTTAASTPSPSSSTAHGTCAPRS